MAKRINFTGINQAALQHSETIVRRWLPDGKRAGPEWVARNPRRNDKKLGSFKINLTTGSWADFASGDRGGDLVSLAAYLHCNGDQKDAAISVAGMLGVSAYAS